MDMQGAFDNLKTESLIRGMENRLYPKRTRLLCKNFLENRTVMADLLGVEHKICPKCRTPQVESAVPEHSPTLLMKSWTCNNAALGVFP